MFEHFFTWHTPAFIWNTKKFSSVQTRDWSWGIYRGFLSTWWDQNLVEDTDAVVDHFIPYAQRYMLDIYGGYSFFSEMKPRWNKTQQRNFDKKRFKFYLKKLEKGKVQVGTFLLVISLLWSKCLDNLKTNLTTLSFVDNDIRLFYSIEWWNGSPLKSNSWKRLYIYSPRCCQPSIQVSGTLTRRVGSSNNSFYLLTCGCICSQTFGSSHQVFTKMQMFLKSGKKIKGTFCAWCARMARSSVKSDLDILNKTSN